MTDSKWFGEPHTLIVRSVRLPDPKVQFDDGDLEYEIVHPQSCKQEERDYGDRGYMYYTCDVAQNVGDVGLEFTLNYSGTPITEPGTYRIQGWGSKTYYWDSGYEYDGGVGLMEPEASE